MIPKDWSGINIKQFIQLYPTFNNEGMTDTEIIDNKALQLSIIKNISLEDAENCTVIEANKVKLLLETPIPDKISKLFRLKGIVYQFNIDANALSTSGYVGSMNAIKEDPIKNMHVSMFNLASPVKYSWLRAKWIPYEFKNEDIGDRMKDFLDMPISVAYPIAVFFLNLSKDLTPVMEDYLKESLTKIQNSLDVTREDLISMGGQ
jgi:hypothetical protein